MSHSLKFTLSAIALTGALFSSASQADIIISGTRIIYDANKKMSAYVWKIKVKAHY